MDREGRVDWRWRTGGDVIGLPVVDDNNVYFVSLDNVLRALDRKTGAQQWLRGLPFRPAWAPVKVGGTIVVAGQALSLRAYKITDGTAAGEVAALAEITAAPPAPSHPLPPLPPTLCRPL